MFTFLKYWWYARARRMDLDILWPQCREQAKDLVHAKQAFALHCYQDKAWLHLGQAHIDQIIDALD